MVITGIQTVESDEITSLDVEKGMRPCLTYGLALACDAVFTDGVRAFKRIDELTATIGLDDTLLVLKENLGSIGPLRESAGCAVDGMDVPSMRMMVLQLQLFRMGQDAKVRALEGA